VLRVVDLVRYTNFLPYRGGYRLLAGLPGEDRRSAAHRVAAQDARRVVLEGRLPQGLVLQTEYVLDGESLSILHRATNAGRSAVTCALNTHPAWALAAFGEDAEVRLRRADGSWASFTLNPERREGRDLEFGDDVKPAGAWQLQSTVQPFVLNETFDPEQIHHTRLTLSRRGGTVALQLHPGVQTIRPGESAVLHTTWRLSSRKLS
jgi:galactose mutarotase-like enzyme